MKYRSAALLNRQEWRSTVNGETNQYYGLIDLPEVQPSWRSRRRILAVFEGDSRW